MNKENFRAFLKWGGRSKSAIHHRESQETSQTNRLFLTP